MDKLYTTSRRNDQYQSTNAFFLNSLHTYLKQRLPSGKPEGSEFVSLNPMRSDSNAGSFRIDIQTGKLADFATFYKGEDLISLYDFLNKFRQSKALKRMSNSFQGGLSGIK